MSEGCSARSRRHRGELSSDALEGQVDGEGHPFAEGYAPAEREEVRSEALAGGPADVARVSATAGRTITVAAWTLISRITGLLRVVVIGAVLGPTFFANAFLSANTVPNLLFAAMAGPVLALVLVPALSRALTERGVADSRRLLGRVTGYLLFWASILAGAIAVASPLVALAVTAGIPDDATRWRAWQLTILIVLFVAPQVLCYTLASIGAAVQQTKGRFALASAAPAVENLGMITMMGVVTLWYRPGVDVPDVSVGMVLVLGVGSTLSVAAHAAVQLYGAYRVGLPIRARGGWSTEPDAHEVSQRLRHSVAVAAFPVSSMFAMLAVAATVPGGVFVFQAALSVYTVIGALGARAVTVAALPGMSAAARDGVAGRVGAAWRQALNYSVMASLPALCLLLAFAGPVASTLANGELHDPRIVRWLTACLTVLAVSQFANAGYEVARQTLFARLDTSGPRRASTAMMAVRIVVTLSALLLLADGDRLVGLCCAVLLGDVTAAVVGLSMVRAAIRPERMVDPRRLAVIGASTLAMLPASALGSWMVGHMVRARAPQVMTGLLMGSVALVCFGLVFAVLTGKLPTLIARVRARLPG
jgi:peptidoglycan biosynthesis protein MviN/MurJ (putative lipid II flippase)